MKNKVLKIFAIVLTFAMLLTIVSCGENKVAESKVTISRKLVAGETVPDNDPTATDGFRVGYGRTEIMPEDPIPLDSYGNAAERISTGFLNELYFSCIAITDEDGKTMLLMSHDITQARDDIMEDLRNYAYTTYGIDKTYVHLSGTHTHSSIAFGQTTFKSVVDYRVKYFKRAHEAIDMAMADRKHATIYAGTNKTESLNFVRNYVRADGMSAGDNWGYLSSAPIVGHMKDADEEMRLIKFCRTTSKGGKAKDVLLMNWQAHDHLSGGALKTDIAADWSGACREYMEQQEDCWFTFFQGCAGNLNPRSTIESENRTLDYNEHGKLLAGYALDVYDSLEQYNTGKIECITETFKGPAVHRYDSIIDKCKEIVKLYKATGNNESAVKDLLIEIGIGGYHPANGIINHASNKTTVEMPISAYRIGDIGWTSAPAELFDGLGEMIRAESPFKLTFTQGYTDANTFGYMPYSAAYDYGCYEACNTKFEQGAGELCAQQFVEMLKKLYNK